LYNIFSSIEILVQARPAFISPVILPATQKTHGGRRFVSYPLPTRDNAHGAGFLYYFFCLCKTFKELFP